MCVWGGGGGGTKVLMSNTTTYAKYGFLLWCFCWQVQVPQLVLARAVFICFHDYNALQIPSYCLTFRCSFDVDGIVKRLAIFTSRAESENLINQAFLMLFADNNTKIYFSLIQIGTGCRESN